MLGSNSNGAAEVSHRRGSVAQLAISKFATCLLTTDRSVSCFGHPKTKAPDGRFSSLVSGGNWFCALSEATHLPACWHDRGRSQVLSATPPKVQFSSIDLTSDNDFGSSEPRICGVEFASGAYRCWHEGKELSHLTGPFVRSVGKGCALRVDGEIECQSGEPSFRERSEPCRLTSKGAVVCPGYSTTRLPPKLWTLRKTLISREQRPSKADGVTDVDVAGGIACGVRRTGEAFCTYRVLEYSPAYALCYPAPGNKITVKMRSAR